MLPIGIGAEGGNFNKIYRDTFTRIVRNGENIQAVLEGAGRAPRPGLREDERPVLGARSAERESEVQGQVARVGPDRAMTTVAHETTLARRRRRWESLPYWLILPTVVYLGLFFVWPMIQGFGLALRDESGNWTTARSRRCGTTPPSGRR